MSGEKFAMPRRKGCVPHSKGGTPDMVVVDADKIIDGKADNMGKLDFKYDAKAETLTSEQHGHWVFNIKGNKMVGTLTTVDGTLFRKISLTKN